MFDLDLFDPDDEPQEAEESAQPQLYEHFRFEAEAGQKLLRVDKFLVQLMPKISRNRIQAAADAGCVKVGERSVKANYKVKPGDVVRVVLDRPPYENEIIPQEIPLDIVYEDEDLMVINKPAGLVVHPGQGNWTGTMLNALAFYFRNDERFDISDPRVGLVHRIDKDTSGLLVVAKSPDAKTSLGKQFYDKTTKREYVALVWGRLDPPEGTIVGNVGRDPRDRMLMTVFPEDSDLGKHAVTHYSLIENLAHVALVRCRLETGRTHQIRVHMRHIGHPLFNDIRYGGDIVLRGNTSGSYQQFVRNCFAICPRHALHAKTLGFVHPRTGVEMNFDSDIPADMAALIEKWRNYANSLAK